MVHALDPHWYTLLSALSLMIHQEAMKQILAAEGVCSIGILRCVLFVNVFTAVEELWEVFDTAKCLPCVGLKYREIKE